MKRLDDKKCCASWRVACWGVFAAALVVLTLPCAVFGQDLDLLDDSDDVLDTELTKLIEETAPNDTHLVGASHLSYLRFWDDVRPLAWRRPRGATGPDPEWPWHAIGDDARPVSDKPIAYLVDVPESGEYRVYLRYSVHKDLRPQPVRLTLTPQAAREASDSDKVAYVAAGDAALTHTYGNVALDRNMSGAEQEKLLPVRFGRATDRIGVPASGAYVWEFADVALKAGVHRVELSSDADDVRVTAFFMTRSKTFRPSLSEVADENTLSRLWVRYRVVDSTGGSDTHPVSASLTFHYRGRVGDLGQPMWGAPFGQADRVKTGEWSPFIDVTDPAFPIPGWATLNMSFTGVSNGMVQMQYAWRPREEAVLRDVRTVNGSRGARMRVPSATGRGIDQPNLERPIWGVWLPVYFPWVQTQEEVVEKYARWVAESRQELGLPADHPTIKGVRLYTGNGVLPPLDRGAYEMLAEMGVNWMSATARGDVKGPPRDLIEKYNLYDDLYGVLTSSSKEGLTSEQLEKVSLVKFGDEIQTAMSPAWINARPAARDKFHQYLEQQAGVYGQSANAFYGVSDLNYIDFPGSLEPYSGRFQRRIFYLAQRYRHVARVPEYQASIAAYEKTFPNVHIYNNYSPHPVFLTGSSMNGGDWFVLTRHKAQTIAWGEDWAGPPTWDLGTDWQCVSYYAALVECAARKHGYPSGFYIVLHSGGPARKVFSCVGQGVTWLRLYDWGPRDAWAEFSNAWSDNRGHYKTVMTATHALGPADTIVSKGEREPRRTAVLYNRSHEIWHAGEGALNHDWMWSFIAHKSSQIPTEVIIEEDLTPEVLAQYKVLHIGGYNIEKHRMKAIREWVEAGGLLIGSGGSMMADEFNDTMQETIDLYGARQVRRAPGERGASPQQVTFTGEGLYPATTFETPGKLFTLEPTTGTAVARFDDGSVAAVEHEVGSGRAILLGFPPGIAFKHSFDADKRIRTLYAWHNAPLLATLGRQRLEYSHHRSEAVLFEHEEGLAVLLSDFSRENQPDQGVLSVRPEREISEVFSGLRRPLEWKRNGDRIEIAVPKLDPVDVIILK